MNSLEEYPGEITVHQMPCHFPSLPIAGLAPVGHVAGNQIIERFQVSRATIKRYVKQQRETGNVLQRPIPGRPARRGTALQIGVQELLEAHPDASQNDYCQWWEAEHSMPVGRIAPGGCIRTQVIVTGEAG
jgi:hypothetical protein